MTALPELVRGDRAPVYIESQVTSRDLHARLLLGARLAAFGHPVLVGRDREVLTAARTNPPGIVIGDHGYLSDRLRSFRDAGYVTYSLCEESTAFVAPDLYQKIRLSPAGLSSSKAIFCTNGQQKELIDEVLGNGETPPRYNTGNVRFELLGESMRVVYSEPVRELKKLYGDFILITTNGKLRNIIDVNQKKQVLIRQWGLSEKDARRFALLVRARASAQQEFIKDILAVAAALPRLRFILRAKYNEVRTIQRLVGNSIPRNVKLVNTGSIQPWVLAASGVIMNNCTTGMDAYAAGTASIFYHPVNNGVEDLEGPAALSVSVYGRTHLAETLCDLPNNPLLTIPMKERFLPSLLRESHREIAQNITETGIPESNSNHVENNEYNPRHKFRLSISQQRSLWTKALRYGLRPSCGLGGNIQHKEVEQFFGGLCELDSSIAEVKLNKKHFELFTLMPK